jgi:hypothetical protein
MNCENYAQMMDDLLEGKLDALTVEHVNSHIFACELCESEFELLKREKEMFSHYLFDIEPPTNLSAQFQAKLAAENPKNFAVVKPTSILSNWKAKLFGSLAFYPATAFAIALIAFGIWWGFQSKSENKDSAQNKPKTVESVNPHPNNFAEKTTDHPLPEKIRDVVEVPQIKGKRVANKFVTKSKPIENRHKSIALKTIQKQPATILQKFKANSTFAKLSEEEKLQIKQIQALETETAKQMEKVEMLLRSFRNARYVEGSERYDVSYEKQQARKLLEKNVQLRERAENFGTLFTEQILSRVEPYLLDIANLDNTPLPEQVLEIKERVKNQSIIASLQTY